MTKPLGPDKRLNPYRSDLAAAYLRGEVEATKFVEGEDWQVSAPRAALLRQPKSNAPMDTELLFGETFRVYERVGDWCWGQSAHDDYVGHVSANRLVRRDTPPTHRVVALRTFRYPEPDIKSRPVLPLSMNAKVAVTGTAGKFVEIAGGGYVVVQHLAKIDAFAHDFVSVAEEFLGVPYLWGGRDARGLDCSGLVQMALERCGIACLRDTDLQEATLGGPVGGMAKIDEVCRGDLIFWRGHVGIMADAVTLLHANATHMRVAKENFREAVNRIEKTDGPVTSIRRLQA
ncbi:MAG: NlpC/P60 family protein [Parvibaculum sp.]